MLREYRDKRDFKSTPEPPPAEKPVSAGPLTFVVQKHTARQLHYDFRLEVDRVLKSWAVAKGPSYDPDNKRLAVMVDDHPLAYADFEGTIPKGQYGAGQVIVWDRGTYSPDENGDLSFSDRAGAEARMREGLYKGKLSIHLRGEKLKGSWTLVRMHRSDKNWLLIKHRDKYADARHDVLAEDASVISGLTNDDLKSGRVPRPREKEAGSPADTTGAVKSPFPSRLSPMLASPAGAPFSDDKWFFEPKLDGFRTLAFVDGGKVRLLSRRGIDVTGQYPDVAEALQRQPVSRLVLDGEIIALDARGKLCFQCLQGTLKSMKRLTGPVEPPSAIIYYVFDILYLDGYDLSGVPLGRRKELLRGVLEPGRDVRLVEHFPTDGRTVYRAAIENGLEGVIAKRQDSLYEPGKRSKDWLKIKAVTSDDFVVGGFTRGTGNRAATFGALLLGYYDDDNNLVYAGNVGSGFNDALLTGLKKRLTALSLKQSPFATGPEPGDGITWVKPEIVVEVKFSEWTRDGRLRAPVFLRVRDDKPATSARPAGVVAAADDSSATAAPPAGDADLEDILERLSGPKTGFVIEIGGQKVSLSHLDKALWPALGKSGPLTKHDLIIYLARVSPWLLPHLKDRPLTLSRYPNGIHGEHFFQKHYQPLPAFVDTVVLSSHDMPKQKYLVCNNLATLLWLGQIADIELHAWFSRVKGGPDFKAKTTAADDGDYYASYPDFIIFDIDPYVYSGKEAAGAEPELNRAAFQKTCQIALELKETLDSLSLPSFVKTSGMTGLHIFVPVVRRADFHGTHAAAETVSRFLLQQHPVEVTVDWAVEKRRGKIFLDYNQNVRGKTLASVYSPRPSPEATVSVALSWDELGNVYPTDFTILNVPGRLAERGDPWAGILEAKTDLDKLPSGAAPKAPERKT